MTKEARTEALLNSTANAARNVEWPAKNGHPAYISEIYGQNVFTFKTMEQTLPKPIYSRFLQQVKVKKKVINYKL